MNFKKWLIIWFLCVMVIPLVSTLNFLIDPFGYNKKFSFYNNVKVKNDERSDKFNHLKENSNYNAALIGKWHLSGIPTNHNHPNNMGIDYYSGIIGDNPIINSKNICHLLIAFSLIFLMLF